MTSQVVYLILPGRQPLELYLCSGLNPNYGSQKVKVNIVMFLIIVISILINVLIPIIIKISNIKKQAADGVFILDKKSPLHHPLTDLSSSFFIIILMALGTSGIAYAYRSTPENLNKYPNYLYTYMAQLLLPNLVSFLGTSLYFVKNENLRVFIFREIRESLQNIRFV